MAAERPLWDSGKSTKQASEREPDDADVVQYAYDERRLRFSLLRQVEIGMFRIGGHGTVFGFNVKRNTLCVRRDGVPTPSFVVVLSTLVPPLAFVEIIAVLGAEFLIFLLVGDTLRVGHRRGDRPVGVDDSATDTDQPARVGDCIRVEGVQSDVLPRLAYWLTSNRQQYDRTGNDLHHCKQGHSLGI